MHPPVLDSIQSTLAQIWGGPVKLSPFADVLPTDGPEEIHPALPESAWRPAEFDRLPHLARFCATVATHLRELWPGAAEPLALFPAFQSPNPSAGK